MWWLCEHFLSSPLSWALSLSHEGPQWETGNGRWVTTWSLKSNTQSRRYSFPAKRQERDYNFLPQPQEFTACIQHFNHCLTELSRKLPPEAELKRGFLRLANLSKTPASPISPQLLPAPVPASTASMGPSFPSSCSPDPHFASCLFACLFLLVCAPGHLTLASVSKRGQQNPRASPHWLRAGMRQWAAEENLQQV